MYARGTRKVGSQLMGNWVTMVLEGSFIKYRMGVGNESTAIATILTSSASDARFQRTTAVFDSLLRNEKYAMSGAVSPARISKLSPSNVI
jgi:hypothetical protein